MVGEACKVDMVLGELKNFCEDVGDWAGVCAGWSERRAWCMCMSDDSWGNLVGDMVDAYWG